MRLRPAVGGDRQIGWLWFAAAAGTLAFRPLWPVLVAIQSPVCLFRRWTGIPCPTCGATRSILAILDGRLAAALGWNPLVAAAAIVFLLGGIAAPFWVARGWPVVSLEGTPTRRWVAAGLVALAANWVWLVAGGRV